MSEDIDPLMRIVREELVAKMKRDGVYDTFESSYNALTPAVWDHYYAILRGIVRQYLEPTD